MRRRLFADRLLPTDDIRPEFMENVISPLGHAVIAYTLDGITDPVASGLETPDVRDRLIMGIRTSLTPVDQSGPDLAEYEPGEHAVKAILAIRSYVDGQHLQAYIPPVWSTFGALQKAAVYRFTSFGNSPFPDNDFFGFSTNGGYSTVIDTFVTMAKHHPELELGNADNAASFLENPVSARLMRSFAAGGNGFPDGFRHLNRAPATKPWRDDPTKPVIDTSGPVLKPDKEVTSAAMEHRDYVRNLKTAGGLGANGLFFMAFKESTGCPLRAVTFDPKKPAQFGGRLHLNEKQLQLIFDYPDPVAAENGHADKGGDPYRIVRDGYAETCRFFAGCLRTLNADL